MRDEPPGDGVAVAPVAGAFTDVAGAVALAELAGDDARDGVTDGNRSARRAAARGKPAEVRPAMLPTGVYPLGSSALLVKDALGLLRVGASAARTAYRWPRSPSLRESPSG